MLTIVKFIGWIALYGGVASGLGGLNTDKGQFYFELPFVVLTALPLYFGLLGKVKIPSLVALLPIITFYAFIDYFFWSMGRVFQWIEVGEVFELVDVLPGYYVLVILGVFGLFGYLLFTVLKKIPVLNLISAMAPIAIVVVFSLGFPASFASFYEQNAYRVQHWSLDKNVKDNGRIMTLFYAEATRKRALVNVSQKVGWLENDLLEAQQNLSNLELRNIHILVLESFLDPTLFPELDLPDDYLTPWMQSLQEFKNVSKSPAYGGSTAQAEFEILCGAPAKALMGSIEFNSFSGSVTSCLPNWLNTIGYRTIAQNAYKPSYFNQVKSYQGVGFNEMYFPKEYTNGANTHLSAAITDKSGPYTFDGDFLDQALPFVLGNNSATSPTLNYMLGIYGHFNFKIDAERFPTVVDLRNTEFDDVHAIANQYYYRTRAVEKAVKEIQLSDPNAIILVVSDHLPPLPGAKKTYEALGYPTIYSNVFYLWDRGQPIRVGDEFNHHQLPWLILALLKGCEDYRCISDDDAERYQQVMAHAMRLKGPKVSHLIKP
ncbi:sulfatase-like hydrolase/transferase [Reinekea forsetii]|nr:sulfatase-like hydrolase/transferase [Reinekea forsetii]